MIPMKKASSDMNKAARAMKQMTRLNALAIGLRLSTTAAPKTRSSKAKIQKRKGEIIEYVTLRTLSFRAKRSAVEESPYRKTRRFLDFARNDRSRHSFLLVPLQHDAVHDAADLEELVFVVHHVFAGEAGDGVIFAQKNRLL